MMKHLDCVIIGGGAAGLASAISLYDQGVSNILILEKDIFLGGILNQCIHPGFGLHYFKEELTGPEYAERLINEVIKRNITYKLNSLVLNVSKDKQVSYINETDGLITLKAETIILATGCYERQGGMIELSGDRPMGVMTAGLAQRYLNIDGYLVGKKIFILGSGNIGLIMARRLTLAGAKVYGVAEINPYSAGSPSHLQQCLADFNIPLYLSHTVSKVIGKARLEKIVLNEVNEKYELLPGTEKVFEVDTLLLSIGLIPSNELLDNLSPINPTTKGAEVNQRLETSIPGIFSCGNVLHVHDLVDQATFEGIKAGENAAHYLQNKNGNRVVNLRTITPKNGISYVIPQKIDLNDLQAEFQLKIRVKSPLIEQYIVFKHGNEIIKRVFKPILLPAEMITIPIRIPTEKGSQEEDFTVSLEAKHGG